MMMNVKVFLPAVAVALLVTATNYLVSASQCFDELPCVRRAYLESVNDGRRRELAGDDNEGGLVIGSVGFIGLPNDPVDPENSSPIIAFRWTFDELPTCTDCTLELHDVQSCGDDLTSETMLIDSADYDGYINLDEGTPEDLKFGNFTIPINMPGITDVAGGIMKAATEELVDATYEQVEGKALWLMGNNGTSKKACGIFIEVDGPPTSSPSPTDAPTDDEASSNTEPRRMAGSLLTVSWFIGLILFFC